MRYVVSSFSILALPLFAACQSVDPSDPDALTEVLVIPGAVLEQGNPPSQGGGSGGAPVIMGGGSIDATSGEQGVIAINFQSPSGYRDCYVQVRGASSYFRVSGNDAATSGRIEIPVNIPGSVRSGAFRLYTCIAGQNGAVSNPINTDVAVTQRSGNGGGSFDCASAGLSSDGEGCCAPPSGQCGLNYCIVAGEQGQCVSSYYTANGRKFRCSNCQNLEACAQQAVAACR